MQKIKFLHLFIALILGLILSGCQTMDLASYDNPTINNKLEEMQYVQKLSAYKQENSFFVQDRRKTDWRLWQTNTPNPASYDIWERIRSGFKLNASQYDKKKVRAEVKWFARHQEYLDRVADRASLYIYHIVEELEKHDLPLELALLPIVESAYRPYAYSHGRAAGLWQFIPGTGRLFGMEQNSWYDGRRDVLVSTQGAIRFLNNLQRQFGDWLRGLAAYNSGNGTVSKAIRRNRARGRSTSFWHLSLPKETRAYVPKLLALAQIVENPEKYGVKLKSIPNHAYFKEVNTHGQIDLALVAELANMSTEDLYVLNPAWNKWSTSPKGPHKLIVPVAVANSLQAKLDDLDSSDRLKMLKHKVSSGDTLLSIANKYKTTSDSIKGANNLANNLISSGQTLLVPVPSQVASAYASEAKKKMQAKEKFYTAARLYYRVRRGDSLWSIARKYKVSTTKLARWNNITNKSRLYAGKRLVILRK